MKGGHCKSEFLLLANGIKLTHFYFLPSRSSFTTGQSNAEVKIVDHPTQLCHLRRQIIENDNKILTDCQPRILLSLHPPPSSFPLFSSSDICVSLTQTISWRGSCECYTILLTKSRKQKLLGLYFCRHFSKVRNLIYGRQTGELILQIGLDIVSSV